MVENATLYEFGVLHSIVHNAWMRAVAGRLGTSYLYSSTIVYNPFVWCKPNAKQKAKIEKASQKILDVRNNGTNSTCNLVGLYDWDTMPQDLKDAHKANDRAVMEAYGFDPNMNESEIVPDLFKLYQERIDQLAQEEEAKAKALADAEAKKEADKAKRAEKRTRRKAEKEEASPKADKSKA